MDAKEHTTRAISPILIAVCILSVSITSAPNSWGETPAGSIGGPSATFVTADTTHQGNWRGVYGKDGAHVIADAANYPAYASVSISGSSQCLWSDPTNNVAGLRKTGAGFSRIAACEFSYFDFTVDMDLTDALSHRIALYCVDFDGANRAQTVEVLNAADDSVLDTQSLSGFAGGTYLVWDIVGHVKFKITNTGPANAVLSGIFFGAGAGEALFLSTDTTHKGNWKNTYGAEGYHVFEDTTNYPAGVTATQSGNTPFLWDNAPTDSRALARGGSGRIAATWYTISNMTLDLDLSSGGTRHVALYFLDWDTNSRTQLIEIMDADTDAVLDSRPLGTFHEGVYLNWNLTGHVKIVITNTNTGSNAVLSGVFFGGGSAVASYVATDNAHQGTWRIAYGLDGSFLMNGASNLPAYATLSATNHAPHTWRDPVNDVRALQKPSPSTERMAACWFTYIDMTIDLDLTDGAQHRVAAYFLDFDTTTRNQTVQVLDANSETVLDSQSLSGFNGGTYLVWNITGHVKIRIFNPDPAVTNAVISGLFFGPGVTSASFVTNDNSTQGNWKGVYGADGFNVINNVESYPTYATVGVVGNTSFTWTPSTTDGRALEKANPDTDHIAACWFTEIDETLDINITDGNEHTLAMYFLDFDSAARAQQIDILNADTGAVLNSQSLPASSFSGGVYLVWTISGHVKIKITNSNFPLLNAVVSGIFFDTPLILQDSSSSLLLRDPSSGDVNLWIMNGMPISGEELLRPVDAALSPEQVEPAVLEP